MVLRLRNPALDQSLLSKSVPAPKTSDVTKSLKSYQGALKVDDGTSISFRTEKDTFLFK
jgi:hypothetical protein